MEEDIIELEGEEILYRNNYKELENKPQINNVELDDNKTLDDLDIQQKLVAGENININGNEISAQDTTYEEATEEESGLMSSTDKSKLNNIEDNAEVNLIEELSVNGVDATITNKKASVTIETGKIDSISVNGREQTIDQNKNVDITMPTKISDLTNDDNTVKDASYVHTDNNFTATEKNKLAGIESEAEVNIIETIKVNNVSLTPDSSKAVDIAVPTRISDLTNDDNTVKDANYVHTENSYTTTEKNKLAGIESEAEVNKIDNISVNNVRQTISNKEVNIILPEDAEYTIVESETTSGYSKSYSLTKDGVEVGVKINIPKDLVVSSGDVKVVTTDDVPYVGARVGDKYIDLILNDPNANHIYIPVKDLVDVYTSGNGINVSSGNVISLVLDASNANGLSLTASGLRLALASTSSNGAMSSTDKTKLNGIETGAEVNDISSISVNGTAQTITNKNVNITVPTTTSQLTNNSDFTTKAYVDGLVGNINTTLETILGGGN